MLRHALRSGLLVGAMALGAVFTLRAAAGGDDDRCYSRYCASVYCDRGDERCYSARRGGREYDGDYRYESGWRDDGDRDYRWSDRRPRYACDSDGDRCYPSYSRYWDYREYYRRHGYHWQY